MEGARLSGNWTRPVTGLLLSVLAVASVTGAVFLLRPVAPVLSPAERATAIGSQPFESNPATESADGVVADSGDPVLLWQIQARAVLRA